MNKVFRVIWSEAQGAWVAVSETTKSHSKRSRKAALALALAAGGLMGVTGYASATSLGEHNPNIGKGSIVIGPADDGECSAPTAATGDRSVSIGCEAGAFAEGNHQTNLGYQAGLGSDGDYNTALGSNAGGNVTGSNNTAVGLSSGGSVTGHNNAAVGNKAGGGVKGNDNAAIGSNAGGGVKGNENLSFGKSAGGSTEGDANVAVGLNAGASVEGSRNASLGKDAGNAVVGNDNAAFGSNAGEQVEGNLNTGFGRAAGQGVKGDSNTSLGNGAGMLQRGNGNLSAGLSAGQGTYGDHNIMLGYKASTVGSTAAAPINRTVVIGSEAKAHFDDTVALGTNAKAEHKNSVALGSQSQTGAAESVTEGVISYKIGTDTKTYTYSDFAGTASGVVSVGSVGAERQIINVAPGAITSTSTDAVNGSQLYGVAEGLNKRIDESGGGGWNVVTSNSNTSPDKSKVAPGAEVDFVSSDKNVAIKHTSAADGNTSIDFALNNDLSLGVDGTDGVDGKIAVNGKDGSSVVINGADGSIGLTGPAGANGTISVTNGVAGVDGKDGITRIVIDGNNEVATMKDGLKFAGNTGATIAKKLNETLTISGGLAAPATDDPQDANASGANLRVDSDGGQLNLVMAKDLTDINSITINNGGPVISSSGIDMGGLDGGGKPTNKITNLAPGTNGTDAVNVDQLTKVATVANAGWNLSGSGEDKVNIGPNGQVNFVGDNNLTVAQTGIDQDGEIKITLNENIDLTEDGSLTIGDTLVNNDGLTVEDAAGNKTSVGAGSVVVTDGTGTTTIGGNQISVGGNHSIVISGDTGTIGGLTNTTWDPETTPIVSGQAATEDQLQIVSTAANAGWNLSGSGEDKVNIGPNGQVNFVGDNNLTVAQTGIDQDGEIKITLNENIDLTEDGSLTIGDTLVNNDGLTVEDAAGNKTSVGAGSVVVTDGTGTTTIGGNQISVGGNHSIVISGDTGTIGGLTNTTWDPETTPIVSGQAATEDQLQIVSTAANAGWNLSGSGEDKVNIGPNGQVNFVGDNNLTVAQTGIDQDGEIKITLNENIDLTEDGSLTTGNTVVNNAGLTVKDDQGNETFTTAAGTTVKNAAGDTTTVGAGAITIAGTGPNGVNQIIKINGNSGDITGLSNTTLDGDDFAKAGRAATEEQLKQGLATATTEVEAGKNIKVTKENPDPNKQSVYTVETLADVDFDSVTSADDAGNKTVLNKEGVAVVDKEENEATYSAAGVNVKDRNGNTTNIAATQITVGGNNPIVMNGNSGMITGLTNTNWSATGPNGFAKAGRAATEEQLKPLGDFLGFKDGNYTFSYNGKDYKNLAEALDSIHWNVEAPDAGGNTAGNTGGGTGGNSGSNNSGSDTTSKTPIANTNTVGFKGDSNLTVSKTERVDSNGKVIGADIQYTLNKDIKVDSITATNVNATNVNATNVTANEVTINNGPVINQNGIDMHNKQITNVADGVGPKDAVNVSQLDALGSKVNQYFNAANKRIDKVDNNARAGIAAAMAAGTLPQSTLPGKSMVTVGASTYRGESALAIGVSRLSDNARTVIKANASADSRGNAGAAVGAGWHW